jgi:hypothetical protein
MINSNISTLIEEIERLSSIQRIFKYGLFKTITMNVYKNLNYEVYNYFKLFLSELSDVINFYNSTSFKVNVNPVDIGESFNVAYSKSKSNEDFIKNYFYCLNDIVFEVVKTAIDEMYINNIKLTNVNSLMSFVNITSNSVHANMAITLLKKYINLISKKPTSFISIISSLKRVYIKTSNMNKIIRHLENKIVEYIKIKNSVDINKTITIAGTD